MKDPVLVGRIVEAMAKAISIPLTIKIRSGFDSEHINAPEIAHIAQESGAAAVAVHGRTRQQYYQGHADWSVIARVKEACIIPIIGNGDINTPQDIIDMRAQTNCDGFMIGRGARGNPWIFHDMKYYYEHGELPDKPDIYEVKDMMLRHARLMVEFKGEYTGIHEMRKHVAWYSVGMYDSAKLRSNVNQVETYEELEELLCRWADSAPEKVIVS